MFKSVRDSFERLKLATEFRRTSRRPNHSTPNPELPLLRRRRRLRSRESTIDLWVMAIFIVALVAGIVARHYEL